MSGVGSGCVSVCCGAIGARARRSASRVGWTRLALARAVGLAGRCCSPAPAECVRLARPRIYRDIHFRIFLATSSSRCPYLIEPTVYLCMYTASCTVSPDRLFPAFAYGCAVPSQFAGNQSRARDAFVASLCAAEPPRCRRRSSCRAPSRSSICSCCSAQRWPPMDEASSVPARAIASF